MANNKYASVIRSAAQLRRLLLETMVGVLTGRVSVPQANSVSALSVEFHKNLRQEWDMACFAAEHFKIGAGNQILFPPEKKAD